MPDPTFLTKSGGDPVADFEALIKRLNSPPDTAILEAGKVIVADIRQRTFAGLEISGQPFIRYSPSYERQKGQINVDLYSKNAPPHMLDALSAQVDNGVLEVGIFGDAELAERARINNEGGRLRLKFAGFARKFKARSIARALALRTGLASLGIPARPWLGPSPQALEQAAAIIGKGILKGP